MNKLIEVKNINTFRGASQVLFNVSFDLYESEVVAIVGHNGAGKSTLLKSILGIIPPWNGSIKIFGNEILKEKKITEFDVTNILYNVASVGVGYAPEERRIFGGLTVEENLIVARNSALELGRALDLKLAYEAFPLLEKLKNRLGHNLSGGEKQILSIARMMMTNPKIMILDEPSAGLSPKVSEMIKIFLIQKRDAGIPIIIVEQNHGFLKDLCHRVVKLDLGSIKFEGSWDDYWNNEILKSKAIKI